MSTSYRKRETKRKLKAFPEYKLAHFAASSSLIVAVLLLFGGYDLIDHRTNAPLLAASAVFALAALLQFGTARRIKSNILINGEIAASTRLAGFSLLIFGVTGNVFVAAAALDAIKKEKSLEYTLAIYMMLTTFSVIAVSALNLFKPYVADLFLPGMGVLLLVAAIHTASLILVARLVQNRKPHPGLEPLAWVLMLTAVTGNVFALLLGLTILAKIRNRHNEGLITWIDVLRRLFKDAMAVLGLFFITLLVALSVCSYFTFEYSLAVENNYSAILLPPSLEYPFGTDDFGRCVFSRIVFGGRISLFVGIVSTLIPVVLGGLLGALAGFYGKQTDNVIMRGLDILYAVPGMLLAIAIVASFGANTFNLIIALSVGSIPTYARQMRATVLTVSGYEYIEAARACGAKDHVLILRHVIPNSLAPMIVKATLTVGLAVISTSSLSYLGLGVEPHIPEWGNILKIGSTYLENNSYLAIYPGLAIILMVLSFNFFGDGLRDALDPKLK